MKSKKEKSSGDVGKISQVAVAAESAQVAVYQLFDLALKGDAAAIEKLRDVALMATGMLDDCAMSSDKNLQKSVFSVAKNSLTWPFRLSAIDEIRNPTKRVSGEKQVDKSGTPDDWLRWLRVGTETGLKLGKGRNFATRARLCYRIWKELFHDKKVFATTTDDEAFASWYPGWSFASPDEKKSEATQLRLVEYVRLLRDLTKYSTPVQMRDAALAWARVRYEDNLVSAQIWPEELLTKAKAAQAKGRKFETVLRAYLGAGFERVVTGPKVAKTSRDL